MKKKILNIPTLRFSSKKTEEVPLFDSIALLKKKTYLILYVAMSIMVTIFIYPYSTFDLGGNHLIPGKIAENSIKAKRTFLFEDQRLTEEKKQSVSDSVLPVFDFDPAELKKEEEMVRGAFQKLHEAYIAVLPDYLTFTYLNDEIDLLIKNSYNQGQNEENVKKNAKLTNFEATQEYEQLVITLQEELGLKLDAKTLKTLKWHHYNTKLEEVILQVQEEVYKRGVISSRESMMKDFPEGVLIRNIVSGDERKVTARSRFYSKENFVEEIMPLVDARIEDKHKWLKRALAVTIDKLVQPTIVFNKAETEARKEKAVSESKPVFISVQKGEMIVREGEVLDPYHLHKLNAMKGTEEAGQYLNNIIGYILFSFMLTFGLFMYVAKFQPNRKKDFQHVVLFCLIYVASFALFRFLHITGNGLYGAFSFLTPNFSTLFIPYAVLMMLMSIFFSKSSIMMATLATLTFSTFYFDLNPLLTMLILGSGFVTFYRVHQFIEKTSVLKLGAYICLVNVSFTLIYGIINFNDPFVIMFESFAAVLGGMLAAIIVSAVVPLIESTFQTTSDLKLIELSDFNHPLLREMVVKAPGTYHHSILVGTLSEEAAKAIGANHLLARVGSYFHDIGKLSKPHYFIENIRGENKHDQLSPTMSALILQEHVKEGVEIAKKHKLLPVIQDFIREHHGTSLIHYFYNKVSGQIDSDALKSIKESFHYDGPTPRSKETAIVMMSDSLEAAARTLDKPTHQSISVLVNKIVDMKKETGQLDHTPLTFNDLTCIKQSFINSLVNMLHSRIEYPEETTQKKEKKEVHVRNISDNKKSVKKEDIGKPQISKEKSRKNLRSASGE